MAAWENSPPLYLAMAFESRPPPRISNTSPDCSILTRRKIAGSFNVLTESMFMVSPLLLAVGYHMPCGRGRLHCGNFGNSTLRLMSGHETSLMCLLPL